MSEISRTHTEVVTEIPAGRWVLGSPSTATFRVRNLGLKTVTGSVPISSAEVTVANGACSVHAELDLSRLDTGNAKRDSDLAKPKLLDTRQFPTMAFDGSGPRAWPGQQLLTGTLAAHGHSIELTLHCIVERCTEHELLVRGGGGFDRLDLGIKAPTFMIGRRIDVELSVLFRRAD
jgi:polyisoprenoid-binding protein YceI